MPGLREFAKQPLQPAVLREETSQSRPQHVLSARVAALPGHCAEH